MLVGSMRVSRKTWYAQGGLRDSRNWRRQRKNGGWVYYIQIEQWHR